MTLHAVVTDAGALAFSDEIMRELGLKPGDEPVIERDARGGFVIRSYRHVVDEVRAEFRRLRGPADAGGSVVDELLAERRAEAACENEEAERGSSTCQ